MNKGCPAGHPFICSFPAKSCYNIGRLFFPGGNLKVKSVKTLIISIFCLILFGACAFYFRNLMFGGIAATYEQAEPNRSEYNEKWISYEVVACLGEFAEGEESYAFIPVGHEYYYLIWMEDGSIMPLSVSKKADKEYLDALTEATYDYIDGTTRMIEMEPRTFVGTVSSLDSDAAPYYKDALRYMEINEADGWVVRNTQLDCSKTRTSYLLLVGAVMIIPVLGITSSVITAKKEKRKKENPEQDYLPR